ncbi:DUF6461 domain-containing protein [Streptomyces sp. NPDC001978]|uniref:DUF6461 domain-containing protein n=1 Tax=Streptomyces sp. NPDC001978 TaxID=3364627 RepID=UPI0036A2960B
MTNATADDYRWFEADFAQLAEAYCITMVRGITPVEVLGLLQAEVRGHGIGVRTLDEHAYKTAQVHQGSHGYLGVAPLEDWSVMVEPNGYIGTLDGALSRLSAGRTAVSHFRNINAVDHFNWFVNAELRLHFEPLFAYYRDGSDPDSLVTPMREVGFAVEEEGADDLDVVTAATFALAERVTGIRLTPEFLENTQFIEGLAPIPSG